MLTESTALALFAYRIGDTLKSDYGIDPLPLYEAFGIDPEGPAEPGERQPNSVLKAMLDRAGELTGDPAIGLRIGQRSEPSHFFVVGHVWLSSSTLAEALEKLLRYEDIINSDVTDLRFVQQGSEYVLSEAYPDLREYPGKLRADVEISSVLRMCEISAGEPLRPKRLDLFAPDDAATGIYQPYIDGPVRTNDKHNALYFDARRLEAPLRGGIPDVFESTCRIADRYLEALDNSKIAHQVRAQLVQLLPGGTVDQEKIASRLYCSASTLQRQLSAEGTSYRDVLDATRRELAEAYLRDGTHSLAQTAFLVGFADQSNFTRAFKRWTGMSPGEFRKSA